MRIDEVLQEGPNDPHIFKAVFLAGGPGSGKSFVANRLLGGTGLRTVNSDDIYEYMMKKQGMKLDPETIFSPAGQSTREKAKEITGRKQQSHIDGRLGLIIDGTGKNVEKYRKTKQMLEDLGYETMMLFVNTSHDVAQERNLQRPRSLEPKVVTKMWNAVQDNLMAFQQLFGAKNFYLVDNSGGLEDPDRQDNFARLRKDIDRFLNAAPRKPEARRWLDAQQPDPVTEDAPVTKSQLDALERAADRVFGKLGIDIEFTRHFLDRVNDERNRKQITIRELGELFAKEYRRWGRTIANMPVDAQAVMKDLSSEINIPFVLNKDGDEKDLVAKTVMRKKDFKTPNKKLPVESVAEGRHDGNWYKDGVEMCSKKCCGQPVTECTCGPDCSHCDCYKKNKKQKTNEADNTLTEETIGGFAEKLIKNLSGSTGLTYDHPRWGEIQADVFELVKQSGRGSRNQKSRGIIIRWGGAEAAHQTGKDRREIRKIARNLVNQLLEKGKPIDVKSRVFGDPEGAYQFGNIIVLDEGEYLQIFTRSKLKNISNYQTESDEGNKTNTKELVKSMRKNGWSVYVSKSPHGSGNDKRLEFEKDGVEFEILGSHNHWELFRSGPTLSGRGEVFDSLDAAINAAIGVAESKKSKKNPGQLKGKESMPAKTKPKTHAGLQRHPHQGKLVGGS